jgi:hypothetical protein
MRVRLLVLAPLVAACGPPGTLSKVEADVFVKSCAQTSCHKGGSGAGELNLEGRTFSRLVNGKTTVPGEVMVVPGKPEASLLMKRLKGTAPYSVMPAAEQLDAERLELVRSWIAAGAKDD